MARSVRGFSIFEHNVDLDFKIILNKENKYYKQFKDSDVDGHIIRMQTDENGFLMPSHIKNDAKLKNFFLGDSTVECSFVDPSNRFPFLVGKLLFDKGISVNTYNAGVSGADTLSLIKVLLMKIFPLHPDIVCLCNVDRELVFLLSQNSDWFVGAENGKEKVIYSDEMYQGGLKERFYNAVKVILSTKPPKLLKRCRVNPNAKINSIVSKDLWKKDLYINNNFDISKVLDMLKKDLDAFISLCKTRNITPILMTQANQYCERNDERIRMLYDENVKDIIQLPYESYCDLYYCANNLVREMSNKAYIIDLDSKIKGDENLYDQVHYTNAGSILAAKHISEYLEKMIC